MNDQEQQSSVGNNVELSDKQKTQIEATTKNVNKVRRSIKFFIGVTIVCTGGFLTLGEMSIGKIKEMNEILRDMDGDVQDINDDVQDINRSIRRLIRTTDGETDEVEVPNGNLEASNINLGKVTNDVETAIKSTDAATENVETAIRGTEAATENVETAIRNTEAKSEKIGKIADGLEETTRELKELVREWKGEKPVVAQKPK